jgi:hypothetical protein
MGWHCLPQFSHAKGSSLLLMGIPISSSDGGFANLPRLR